MVNGYYGIETLYHMFFLTRPFLVTECLLSKDTVNSDSQNDIHYRLWRIPVLKKLR